jgi:MFS family permease
MSARLFFGWKVVWTAFAVAVVGWGLGFYGPSVLLQLLHERRGWSLSVISAAISFHFLLSAVLIVFSAEIHARLGLWRVTAVGSVLLAIGVVGWAVASEPWQLFLLAIPTGAGWAATSGAAINAMVAPWFRQRRAAALSLAFNGASVGGVVLVPLWIWLDQHAGLIAAAVLIGGAAAGSIAVLARLYLRPTPEDLGLAPDGVAATEKATPSMTGTPLPRGRLVRDRRFVTLTLGFALALFAQVGLLSHLVALLSPSVGTAVAGWMVSATTVMAVAGRTILGFTIGAADRRLMTVANLLVQAVGVVLLAVAMHPALLLVGCLLFGVGVGNLVSLMPLVVHVEFEPVDTTRVVALVIAVNQAVFSFAPGIIGALRDLGGDYGGPLLLVGALQLLAIAALLAGRR